MRLKKNKNKTYIDQLGIRRGALVQTKFFSNRSSSVYFIGIGSLSFLKLILRDKLLRSQLSNPTFVNITVKTKTLEKYSRGYHIRFMITQCLITHLQNLDVKNCEWCGIERMVHASEICNMKSVCAVLERGQGFDE